jgi:hypothetical protein
VSAAFDVPLADILRRPGIVRARTISVQRLSKRALERGRAEFPEHYRKPRTWGECLKAGRGTSENPCGFVSCRHHLYLDVDPDTGSIKINHPELEPHELARTCALRVAEEDGVTLDAVAGCLGVVRERIRQIERDALRVLRVVAQADHLDDYSADIEQRGSDDLWGEP